MRDKLKSLRVSKEDFRFIRNQDVFVIYRIYSLRFYVDYLRCKGKDIGIMVYETEAVYRAVLLDVNCVRITSLTSEELKYVKMHRRCGMNKELNPNTKVIVLTLKWIRD